MLALTLMPLMPVGMDWGQRALHGSAAIGKMRKRLVFPAHY